MRGEDKGEGSREKSASKNKILRDSSTKHAKNGRWASCLKFLCYLCVLSWRAKPVSSFANLLQPDDEVDNFANLRHGVLMTSAIIATSLALDVDPKKLVPRERKILDALKKVMAQQGGQTSPLALARLTATAFEMVVGATRRASPQVRVARALARGLAVRQQLALEEGGSMSSEETARLIGISKTAVLKRYQNGKLLGWRGERQGAIHFPVWQFDDNRVLPGLTDVLGVLGRDQRLDDWGKVLFFLQNKGRLGGRRPLDLLRESKLREVLLAAEAYVE